MMGFIVLILFAIIIVKTNTQQIVNRNVNDPAMSCPEHRWNCPDLNEMITDICKSSKFSDTVHTFGREDQKSIFSSNDIIGDVIIADVDHDGDDDVIIAGATTLKSESKIKSWIRFIRNTLGVFDIAIFCR